MIAHLRFIGETTEDVGVSFGDVSLEIEETRQNHSMDAKETKKSKKSKARKDGFYYFDVCHSWIRSVLDTIPRGI